MTAILLFRESRSMIALALQDEAAPFETNGVFVK
jgi:hypothetical protein